MSATIIKLSNCDKHVLVDPGVADRLRTARIWLGADGYPEVSPLPGQRRHSRRLHRVVMHACPGQIVDHINGDKLDSRAANLRIVSPGENSRNRHHKPRGASGFLSVVRFRSKWQVQCARGTSRGYFGTWRSAVVASVFADAIRRDHLSPYCALNYPRVVLRDGLGPLLDSTAGRIFRVAFSKRSDGSLRTMNCRIGVHKFLRGGPRSYGPADHNLYIVYDVWRKGYRAIPLERVISLRINKANVKVVERRVSWAS